MKAEHKKEEPNRGDRQSTEASSGYAQQPVKNCLHCPYFSPACADKTRGRNLPAGARRYCRM